MKTCAHVLCYNEVEMLPWTLRHYLQFCDQIVVHDLGSSDGCQEMARTMGAEIVQHDCKQEFDDRLNQTIKNTAWKETPADWIIMADIDELIYFPMGAPASLGAYVQAGVPVVKPYGFEMFSDVFPYGDMQITRLIKSGARDDKWYAKPILFSPNLVQDMAFGVGAHEATGTLKTGQKFANPTGFTEPPCFLLHYHHIGSFERIARRYDENRARQSAINRRQKWGNQDSGAKHTTDKRALIVPRLERVVL